MKSKVVSVVAPFIFLCLFSSKGFTQALTTDAKDGMVLFQCSVLSEVMGNGKQERLFLAGYNNTRRIVEAVRNKKVTESELQKLPTIFLMLLSGPSTDFAVGRIYENTADTLYKQTFCKNGPANCISDKEVKNIIATNIYNSKSCDILERSIK